jgi:hypothetical protein
VAIEPFVQAERSRPFRRDVEESEAICYNDFATIQKGPESQTRVHHEIGDSHFSREYEGYWRGEESRHHQQATDGFNHAGDQKYAVRRAFTIQEPENFLHAVACNHESHHEPQQYVGLFAPFAKNRSQRHLPPIAVEFALGSGRLGTMSDHAAHALRTRLIRLLHLSRRHL